MKLQILGYFSPILIYKKQWTFENQWVGGRKKRLKKQENQLKDIAYEIYLIEENNPL